MQNCLLDYRPKGARMWVEELPEARRSRGGVFMPDRIQPEVAEGIVRRIGTDCGVEIKEGEWVVIPARQGQRYEWGGCYYRLVVEDDVMGVVLPMTGYLQEGYLTERMVRVVGRWVLTEWEEAKDTILGGRLLRGSVGKKAHFTGLVMMSGPKAEDVEPGERYFFEQFSDFRSWQEGTKRFALMPYEAIYAEIPPRTEEVCLADSEVASPDFEKSMTRTMA